MRRDAVSRTSFQACNELYNMCKNNPKEDQIPVPDSARVKVKLSKNSQNYLYNQFSKDFRIVLDFVDRSHSG